MGSRGVRSSLLFSSLSSSRLSVFFSPESSAAGFWAVPLVRNLAGRQLTRHLKKAVKRAVGNALKIASGDRPYLRDDLGWSWTQRGPSVRLGESAAGLRFQAYKQKMAMRAQRASAAANATPTPKRNLGGAPAIPPLASNSNSGSTVWAPLGPAPLASDATGDGAQDYNWVSGRCSSLIQTRARKRWWHRRTGEVSGTTRR
jgi:hypothetical protein